MVGGPGSTERRDGRGERGERDHAKAAFAGAGTAEAWIALAVRRSPVEPGMHDQAIGRARVRALG